MKLSQESPLVVELAPIIPNASLLVSAGRFRIVLLIQLLIIRILRYVATSVHDIIGMVKASVVFAEVSPEKLAPLESVAFEDRELFKVGDLKAVLGT